MTDRKADFIENKKSYNEHNIKIKKCFLVMQEKDDNIFNKKFNATNGH